MMPPPWTRNMRSRISPASLTSCLPPAPRENDAGEIGSSLVQHRDGRLQSGEQLTFFSFLASAPDEAFSPAPISLIPFRHLPNAGNLQYWANPAPTVEAHRHIWWEVSLLRRPCF